MKATAFIGLSSPGDSANFFSKLLTLTERDGSNELFFRVINCLLVCKPCQKLSKEEQMNCNHVKSGCHWLSVNKTKRLKRLYAADPATALRELSGIVSDDNEPCFDRNDILRIFDLPHVDPKTTPKYVLVSCDPSGGGASKMAITSGYFDAELNFVVKNFYFIRMYISCECCV